MKVVFLGGGNMAAALIGGLLKTGLGGSAVGVVELDAQRRGWLSGHFGVDARPEADGLWQAADVLILAVKPQQLRAALQALPPLRPEQLVLSVAAGVRAADIARWLSGHPAVIRAMPNTPALVGAGITGLYALPGVSPAQRERAGQIMAAVGSAVWVEEEALIDAVTAISGSGPAYVFYLIEALEAAGVELGLPADVARQLSLHTFLGAAQLAMQDDTPPAELRARVTSKGGTTEQGIRVMEEAGIKATMLAAARAAAARGRELGDLLGAE